jgi:nicotinamidase/pyrazinamidase
MKQAFHMLIIDPQNDFCDLPAERLAPNQAPALPVPGAHADMLRIAGLIERAQGGIAGISVTLDTHHRLDVAHPTFWTDARGGEVAPFTQITAADLRGGRYAPRDPAARERVLAYLDRLEAAGRYTLMVWPVHCEIGSWGQLVHADVLAALNQWESNGHGVVNRVVKGTNPWTEHYSAIEAEVPDADDESTQRNAGLIALLGGADRVYICGEAGSHCVRATTEHLVANLDTRQIARLVLLTDCMSPVSGFEPQQQAFIDAMAARGARLATAAEVLPELLANAR